MRKGKDLTGQRFGRLTVIERTENKGKYAIWKSLCDCGNYTISRTGSLTSGQKLSCGCLHREMASKLNKPRRNEYEVLGDKVQVYLRNSDEKLICDIDDWEKLKHYTWFVNDMGYAMTHKNVCGKDVMENFHVEVMGKQKGMVVDHINRNKLDNRKENLRFVTQRTNVINQGIRKTNTSGVTGVRKRKDTGRWTAHIVVNYKSISLGCYDTKAEAVNARKIAEEKYFKPLLEER